MTAAYVPVIINQAPPPRYDIAICQTMDTKQEVRDCLTAAKNQYCYDNLVGAVVIFAFLVVGLIALKWWVER